MKKTIWKETLTFIYLILGLNIKFKETFSESIKIHLIKRGFTVCAIRGMEEL